MLYGLVVDLKALVALAGQLDEKAFLERNPSYALIIKKKGRPSEGDPFESDLDWRTRTKKGLYGGKAASGTPVPRKDPLAKLVYAPLVKSSRNPFAGMITVGRTPNNDVCLSFSSVSKLHAYFQNENGRWTVRDSMSSFGTFVNGEKVPPDTAISVQDGSAIGFGPDIEGQLLSPKAVYAYLLKLGKEIEKPAT